MNSVLQRYRRNKWVYDRHWNMIRDVILKKNKPFQVALDIGTRHGEMARFIARDFQKIHCFEARKDKDWIKIAKKLLGAEVSNKVCFHDCALGDKEEEILFGKGLAWEHTNGHQKKTQKPVTVQQKTLDSFKIEKVNFIKLDVEGHEFKVLKGAVETITKNKPVIFMEHCEKFGNVKKASDFLKSLGYEIVAGDARADGSYGDFIYAPIFVNEK